MSAQNAKMMQELQRVVMIHPNQYLNRALTFPLLAFALVWVFSLSRGDAPAATNDGKVVELTQLDLFGFADWEHRGVAVDGFVLGMSRSRVFEIAKASKLALRANGLREGLAKERLPVARLRALSRK